MLIVERAAFGYAGSMAHPTRRTFIEGAGLWIGTLTLGCGSQATPADDEEGGDGGETELGSSGTTRGSSSSSEADSAADSEGSSSEGTSEETTDATTGTDPEECVPTSPNIEGPFYLEGVPVRTNLDLYGDEGTKLALSGVVRGIDCAPLAGVVVELWQCDPSGDYDNTSPEMRYRGQTMTDARGHYAFSTLVPGRYPNAGTLRPAHLHVKVWVQGRERLTTQLYFEGDPFNDTDPWFEDELLMAMSDDGAGGLLGEFDLVVTGQ